MVTYMNRYREKVPLRLWLHPVRRKQEVPRIRDTARQRETRQAQTVSDRLPRGTDRLLDRLPTGTKRLPYRLPIGTGGQSPPPPGKGCCRWTWTCMIWPRLSFACRIRSTAEPYTLNLRTFPCTWPSRPEGGSPPSANSWLRLILLLILNPWPPPQTLAGWGGVRGRRTMWSSMWSSITSTAQVPALERNNQPYHRPPAAHPAPPSESLRWGPRVQD